MVQASISHDSNFRSASVDLLAGVIETALIDFVRFLQWMVMVPWYWAGQIVEEIDFWMHQQLQR